MAVIHPLFHFITHKKAHVMAGYTKYDLLAFYKPKNTSTDFLDACFINNSKLFIKTARQPVSFEPISEEIEKMLLTGRFAIKRKRVLKYETKKTNMKQTWDMPKKPFLCEGSLFQSLADLSLQTKKNVQQKNKAIFSSKEIEKKKKEQHSKEEKKQKRPPASKTKGRDPNALVNNQTFNCF